MSLVSTPNGPTFLLDHLALHWQMTRCEKLAFHSLLEVAQAEVAIEIGTYQGGSLQVIAQHAQKVYSLDISPDCKEKLGPRFPNVEFLVGDSKQLIAGVLDQIQRTRLPLGFVLIDGDHTTAGVRGDVNAILRHVPTRPVYIVFHDSFHPACREGILQAEWQECPFVHFVEVDFIPGVFHHQKFDTAEAGSMYGGLAVALMLPERRSEPLVIHRSQQGLFDVVYEHSCHQPQVARSKERGGMWGTFRRRLLGSDRR